MIRKSIVMLALLMGMLFSLTTFAAAPITQDKLGVMHEHQYKNAFFGFTMQFPKEWYALDQNHLRKLSTLGAQLKPTQKKLSLQKLVNENSLKAYYLFVVTKMPIGQTPNASVQAKVINLKKIHSKIKSPEQYLGVIKFGLARLSRFKAQVDVKLPKINIGGLKFSQMSVAMDIGKMKVMQHYYAAKRDHYLLMFMTSYVTADDGKVMKEIVDSARFS